MTHEEALAREIAKRTDLCRVCHAALPIKAAPPPPAERPRRYLGDVAAASLLGQWTDSVGTTGRSSSPPVARSPAGAVICTDCIDPRTGGVSLKALCAPGMRV